MVLAEVTVVDLLLLITPGLRQDHKRQIFWYSNGNGNRSVPIQFP